MSKISRRLFLKAAPTAPIAARKAADEIAQQTGASLVGQEAQYAADGEGLGGFYARQRRFIEQRKKLQQIYRTFGYPNFRKKELRRTARHSRLLDPDVAALQSVSMGFKLRLQWKRREAYFYERDRLEVEEMIERAAFATLHGIDENEPIF